MEFKDLKAGDIFEYEYFNNNVFNVFVAICIFRQDDEINFNDLIKVTIPGSAEVERDCTLDLSDTSQMKDFKLNKIIINYDPLKKLEKICPEYFL